MSKDHYLTSLVSQDEITNVNKMVEASSQKKKESCKKLVAKKAREKEYSKKYKNYLKRKRTYTFVYKKGIVSASQVDKCEKEGTSTSINRSTTQSCTVVEEYVFPVKNNNPYNIRKSHKEKRMQKIFCHV